MADGVGLCRYGFNYVRLSPDLLAMGFLVARRPAENKRHRQKLKRYGMSAILIDDIDQLLHTYGKRKKEDELQAQGERLKYEERVLSDPELQSRLIEDVEEHVQRAAGQLHDYLDLAAQILKQLNVYLTVNYSDIEVPEGLDAAPDELQSIYWLARLMEEKVSAFGYYTNPASIRRETSSFRLHGLITKYKKMYARDCQQKRLSVKVASNYSVVTGNSDALSVIVHSLFDNAVKYAPSGSEIQIDFERKTPESSKILFRIGSLGPKLEPAERTRIFFPFVRGAAASEEEVEGMGFGLAFAQRIAAEYGEEIGVVQTDRESQHRGYFWTEFTYPFTLS